MRIVVPAGHCVSKAELVVLTSAGYLLINWHKDMLGDFARWLTNSDFNLKFFAAISETMQLCYNILEKKIFSSKVYFAYF